MGFILLFIFIAVPVIEIGLFIQVGGAIGVLATLAIVVITAIIGTYLLRQQGLGIIAKAQSELNSGKLPVENLIHGAFIVVAGLLLLTPGFFTDFIGFSLFIPQLRLFLGRKIAQKLKNSQAGATHQSFYYQQTSYTTSESSASSSKDEIEGEFEEVKESLTDENLGPKNDNSPWKNKE